MSGAPTHSPLTHADRALLAASAAYLFVAPASGSSGLRTAFALIAAGILAFTLRGALLAAVGLVIGFAASVLERNAEFFRNSPSMTASIDNDLRPRLWSTAWDEFRKSPWIGHGFGRTILRDRFLPLTPAKVNHPPMEHAHNAFVDAALQVGVLGLAALGVLFFALAREYARFLRDARVAPWGVIGLATIAGFVVKNLTDDFFYRHNALVFWAINGILLGLASSLRPPRPASA